jgi:hypothetical protein
LYKTQEEEQNEKRKEKNIFKGIGSILFLKNRQKKNAEKIIKIISEVIIMRYVQL